METIVHSYTRKQAPAGWHHLLGVHVAAVCAVCFAACPATCRLPSASPLAQPRAKLAAKRGRGSGDRGHQARTNRHCQDSITSCDTSCRWLFRCTTSSTHPQPPPRPPRRSLGRGRSWQRSRGRGGRFIFYQPLTNKHLLAGITCWMYESPLAVSLYY
jgi:hypothetical protein